MLKINNFHTAHLHNDAHFQFYTEVRDLVGETTPAALKLEAAWPAFLSRYEGYDAALRKIVKSALTEKIKAADAARDAAFSGFTKFLSAMCEHYDDSLRDIARKIEVVAHTYGNVAVKPINEETSAIYNMVQDLNSDNYRTLVTQIGLMPWVTKLSQKNNEFETLIQERDRESAAKNHAAVSDERKAIDEIYRHIVNAINAFIFFGELTGVGAFVDTLNAIIHRFSIKYRHHKRGAEGAEPEDEPEEVAETA
jgi:cobalamin biosynthesis Mg chelatase CobN